MDLATSYHHATDQFLILTGWSDKMAHLNAGMAIYVLTQLMLRTRRASLPALAVVVAMELCNEGLDALFYGELRVADSLMDIAYTIAWPAIITFIGLYRRGRWKRHYQEKSVAKPRNAVANSLARRGFSA